MAVKELHEDLLAIFNSNEVPAVIRDWCKKNGCLTVKNFANWVDEKNQLKESIFDQIAEVKNDRCALSALKQAWREAESVVARGVKRQAEGIPDEAVDDPLPDPMRDNLIKTFTMHYKWDLEPHRRGSESLLGRLKREADAYKPPLLPISRVKSLAHSNRSADSKRHRLTDFLQLEFESGHAGYAESSDKLRDILNTYEILANTWALTGCFQVTVRGKKVMYAHWQLTTKYVRKLRERTEALVDRFLEPSVIAYLQVTEEAIRGYAIEATRAQDVDEKLPWGMALMEAMSNHSYLWMDNRELLLPRRSGGGDHGGGGSGGGNSKQGGGGGKPGGGGGKQMDKPRTTLTPPAKPFQGGGDSKGGGKGGSSFSTCTHTQGGGKICKLFNDKRGCGHKGTEKCSRGDLHGCDVRLASTGQACASKSHNRVSHDSSRHGTPAART